MDDLLTLSVRDFLEATAARRPAPGGGAATALVGGLAAALAAMALEYTVGKKAFAGEDRAIREALGAFQSAGRLFQELIAEDAARLKGNLSEAARVNLGRVVIDASAMPFVDSRGIEALLDVSDELAQGGRALKLAGARATVRVALDRTGAAESMEFYDDVHTVVRSFL